jgi:hypothetical protein
VPGPLHKLVISGFIAGVVGFQAWVIGPGTPDGWYWPFIDYPMYSEANPPGTPYREWRVAVVPLPPDAPPGDTLRADSFDLGIYYFTFYATMDGLRRRRGSSDEGAAAISASGRDSLTGSVARAFGLDGFELIVEERAFEITSEGLVSSDPPWVPVESWVVEDGVRIPSPESRP